MWSASFELPESVGSSDASTTTSSSTSRVFAEVDIEDAFRDVNIKVRAKGPESKREMIGSNTSRGKGATGKRSKAAPCRDLFFYPYM